MSETGMDRVKKVMKVGQSQKWNTS